MLDLRKLSTAMAVCLSLSWATIPALASGPGGGGGGGGTTTPPPSNLPTTPPAPNILIRESFGLSPNFLRPAGGKGLLKATNLFKSLGGFWVEYPGSNNTQWITPDGWTMCPVGGYLDPYALPSPLESTDPTALTSQGVACSTVALFDAATPIPTALLPFKQPAAKYAVSMEGWAFAVAGTYVSIGLTASGATTNNFNTVGQVWLNLRNADLVPNGPLTYEWRLNGRTGPLLATGTTVDQTYNRMEIHYDPIGQLVNASVNGVDLGSFPLKITPSFVGFEGVGNMDNFVVSLDP